MNKLLQSVCGMVEFSASNGFCERLINLCANNNISLKNLRKTDVGFIASVSSYDYKKVDEFSKKVNVEVAILSQKGAWFKAKKYKGRWGIAVGIVAFMTLLYISTGYIWDIRVEGNVKLKTAEILQELENIGISRGEKINDIDFILKKQEALLRLPELAWMTLNQSGSTVEVIVSERYATPIINDSSPCDIIAKKTGQIRFMEVYGGVKVIGEGYPVQKGDLLVSGTFTNKHNEITYLHSSAKIIAVVQFDKTLSVDLTQCAKKYTGKKKNRYYIEAFSAKIPLFVATKQKGDFDIIKTTTPLNIFGTELPFKFTTHEYNFYDKIGENLSKQEAEKILLDSFSEYELLELSNSAIIKKEINSSINKNIFSLTISYTVEEDIGEKVEIMN